MRRLDERLVEQGTATDLDAARRLVEEGSVLVDGAPARSAARRVAKSANVRVLAPKGYVSRGAEKLRGALDDLGIEVAGSLAMDVGSSTGGFTELLLARGADRVLAVDVGHHQLHERLAGDARVASLEDTNVLDLTAARVQHLLGARPGLVTVDVAFTSLTRLAAHVTSLAADAAVLLYLVKPQFEAPREVAARGHGVVDDPDVWRSVLTRCSSAIEDAGAGIIGVVASRLAGTAGNREFFAAARKGGPRGRDVGGWIDAAVGSVP